jgi:hypothetical protein
MLRWQDAPATPSCGYRAAVEPGDQPTVRILDESAGSASTQFDELSKHYLKSAGSFTKTRGSFDPVRLRIVKTYSVWRLQRYQPYMAT